MLRYVLLVGRDTVYSELRGQSCTSADAVVNVKSADGFVIEQYSRVRSSAFSVAVLMLSIVVTCCR